MSHQVVLLIGFSPDKANSLSERFQADALVRAYTVDRINEALPILHQALPELLFLDADAVEAQGDSIAEFCRTIRYESHLEYRPVIVIYTAREDESKRIEYFIQGADDILPSVLSDDEIRVRVLVHLRRSLEQLSHPTTRLPGHDLAQRIVQRKINLSEPWALMYVTLDNFDAYMESYGRMAADQVLRHMAALMYSLVKQPDFVGQMDYASFVVITHPEKAEKIAGLICRQFENSSPNFYSEADKKQGYIVSMLDNQISRRVRLMSLSIGIVSSLTQPYTSYKQVYTSGIEMVRLAKISTGSVWVSDRLKLSTQKRPDETQTSGYERKAILVVESDAAMAFLLRSSLELQGYDLETVGSGQEASEIFESGYVPDLVVMDSLISGQLLGWDLCRAIKQHAPHTKVIIISTVHDRDQALKAGADLYMPKPFDLLVLFQWIEEMMGRRPETV